MEWVARERAVCLHSALARNLLHSTGMAGMGEVQGPHVTAGDGVWMEMEFG
jgi:hypothetical protein